MAEEFEDAGQRYAFLLRPVKDLSKNFEINIAKELDEYCDRLEGVSDDAHNGVDNGHRFNFAEAAMLIQGSAFVFGRKVDYLHAQAVHFFEIMQPQKTKKKKKNKGGEDDEDEGFADDDAVVDPCDLKDYERVKVCSLKSLLKNCKKSKYKGHPPKIKVMPMSLMPLSDDEKNGVLIYSTGYRMEIIGKMDDFKMNAGFLTTRGVLLLHLAHKKIIDDFASEAFVRLWYPHLFDENGKQIGEPFGGTRALLASHTKKSQSQQTRPRSPDSGRGTPIDELGGGDAGRAPSEMEVARRGTANTFNDVLSARPSTRLTDVPGFESQKTVPLSGGDNAYMDTFDGGVEAGDCSDLPVPPVAEKRPSRLQQPQILPWQEKELQEDCTESMHLDPFENVRWKCKPIEKITRFVRGSTIATRIEKAEKASMTFQKRTMKTNDYIKEHFFMRKKQKTNKGDDWQADALYRFMVAVMKKRAEAKRESRKAKTKPVNEAVYYDEDDDNVGGGDDGEDYEEDNNEKENAENVPPDTNAVEGVEGPMNTQEVVQSHQQPNKTKPSIDELMFGDIDDDELNNSIEVDSLYGGLSFGEAQQTTDKGKKAFSLLELLHQHMLKYWSTTEEVTSELVNRVQEWEDTMNPILEEEETRKEFDIHEYGDELLAMFSDVGETKTMKELLVGKKKYEISRYFLACLMMANTYNVRVDYDTDNGENSGDPNAMRVTLLKRARHHEVFDQDGAL